LGITEEMKKRGVQPEQAVIEIPIDVWVAANLASFAYNKAWAKNFKFEWKGHKWTQEDLRRLWDKINTRHAQFSDAERAAIKELQRLAAEQKKGLGYLWKQKELYLRTRVPTPTPSPTATLPRPPSTMPAPTTEKFGGLVGVPAYQRIGTALTVPTPSALPTDPDVQYMVKLMVDTETKAIKESFPNNPQIQKELIAALEQKDLTPEAIRMVNKTEALWTGTEKIADPEITRATTRTYHAINEIDKNISAQPGFFRPGDLIKNYEKLHDFTWRYGIVKREAPEVYKQAMARFHKRNASIEKSVHIAKKARDKVPIDIDEDAEMAFGYEDKMYMPTVEHKDVYKKLTIVKNTVEKAKLSKGIVIKPFQERMIEENNEQIAVLLDQHKMLPLDPRGRPTGRMVEIVRQIEVLKAENEMLKNIRHLPHKIVAQRVIENKLAKLEGEERRVFIEKLSKISYTYGKRTGRVTLRDYVRSGLLTKEDVGFTKLVIDDLDDYFRKSAMLELHNVATARGFIRPFSASLKEAGWLKGAEAGISAWELRGKVIHPVYAELLNEIKKESTGRGGAVNKLFGITKAAQFIKPTIIGFYNTMQHIQRGMWVLNPITNSVNAAKAISAVATRNELYHTINGAGGYQAPAEMPRATQAESKRFLVDHMKELPTSYVKRQLERAKRITESVVGKKLSDHDFIDVAMMPIRALANVTWTMDKMQRTFSVLNLQSMGYPFEEAVRVAAEAHGGYSLLSSKFKRAFSKVFFVYSFRVLMPREMIKTAYEPAKATFEALFKGKKIPKHKMERMIKAIIGTVATFAAPLAYFKSRGFEPDKKYWKWKKTVKDPVTGEEREVVVAMNNIINMPIKWYHRFAVENPVKGNWELIDKANSLFQYELHPLYRVVLDVINNRPSLSGELDRVYNPKGSGLEIATQVATYMMSNLFRHTTMLARGLDRGTLTRKEKAIQDRVIDEALTWYEKILFGRDSPMGFGYSYARNNKDDVGRMWIAIAQGEYRKSLYGLRKYEEGAVKEKERQAISEWYQRCLRWIEKTYGINITTPELMKTKIKTEGGKKVSPDYNIFGKVLQGY
jgi:hypothetical protein